MNCEIRKSKRGPYYELVVNGKFEGNYDNFTEAARQADKMEEEAEKKAG